MKTYKVAVEWSLFGETEVEANSLEEAIQHVKDNLDDIPLPQGEYIDGSFAINKSLELQQAINK